MSKTTRAQNRNRVQKDRKRRRIGLRAIYDAAVAAAPGGCNAKRLAAAAVYGVVKAQYQLSYARLAEYLEDHKEVLRICGVRDPPSRSKIHQMVCEAAGAGPGFVSGILRATAGRYSYGTLVGDSTGFGTGIFDGSWCSAKYGDRSKRGYVKLHVITDPRGRIVGFEVTDYKTGDSPVFRRILAGLPDGAGAVLLDKAYDAHANCEGIVGKGRVPVILPREGSIPRGFGARAKMIRWYVDRPGEFLRAYHGRSIVESVFSRMKRRTGASVRARSLRTRTFELFSKILVHNMTV